MKEALCFNDRNCDAKNNMVLKIMKMIGLMKGPVDYDSIIEKEKMITCLCNNIKFFENEANVSLIRAYLRGKGKMENVVPLPSMLCTSIYPPCCFTIEYTVARPRPVPLFLSFVVKKGSKICSRLSRAIPAPVSEVLKITYEPGGI